jgi:hypothetical protein
MHSRWVSNDNVGYGVNATFNKHNVDSLMRELNVVERSACNYSHPTWKLVSRVMVAKVLQIASWVPMHLLP